MVENAANAVSVPSWLVTHRPFWAVASYTDGSGVEHATLTDTTLQAALAKSSQKALPKSVGMVLAGHVHLFEKLQFTDGKPPQLVFGGGGTKLDPALEGQLASQTSQVLTTLNADAGRFVTSHRFDYGVVTATGTGWDVQVITLDGGAPINFQIPR